MISIFVTGVEERLLVETLTESKSVDVACSPENKVCSPQRGKRTLFDRVYVNVMVFVSPVSNSNVTVVALLEGSSGTFTDCRVSFG
jgi:hypothetical protein